MDAITTTEAAAMLDVSRRQILKLIQRGAITAARFGRDWQVDSASVEAYKESYRKPGPRPAPRPPRDDDSL